MRGRWRPLICESTSEVDDKIGGQRKRRQIRGGHKLSGQAQSHAVDKLGGTKARISPNGGPNAQQNQRQMIHPLWGSSPGAETLLYHSVHSFNHPIALRVISGSAQGRNPQQEIEFRPEGRSELSPLIGSNVHWDTKSGDPMSKKRRSTRGGHHVSEGNSLEPPRRPVQHSQQIAETL